MTLLSRLTSIMAAKTRQKMRTAVLCFCGFIFFSPSYPLFGIQLVTSTKVPLIFISKCRWLPVELPVEPT